MRPARYLSVFLILLVGLYLAVFLTGNKQAKPKLGIDLQGGTRVTLTARTPDGSRPTREALNQAQQIISARVNGLGVSGSEVVIDGDNLVITVPGTDGSEARNLGQTARLFIRPVVDVVPVPQQRAAATGRDAGAAAWRDAGAAAGCDTRARRQVRYQGPPPGADARSEPGPLPAGAPEPAPGSPEQPAPQPRPYPQDPPPSPTPRAAGSGAPASAPAPAPAPGQPLASGAGSAQGPGGQHRVPEGAAAEPRAGPGGAQCADGDAVSRVLTRWPATTILSSRW